MFSHIMIGANDIEASRKFYDTILGTLDIPRGREDGIGHVVYATQTGVFALTRPNNGEMACHANGGTIGFAAHSREQVHAWHDAGVAAGGKSCEDPPGVREVNGRRLYLAYLRDPVGNKLCALYHMPL